MAKKGQRLVIIVMGLIVRWPQGGMTWHYLNYILGLKKVGHDVYFMEDSDDYESCWNPVEETMSTSPEFGLRYTDHVFSKIGLKDHWGYYDFHTNSWLGPLASKFHTICKSADMVINVSGVNAVRDWMMEIPMRVYIDTDPGFTQVKNLTKNRFAERVANHNVFFTFGENFGKTGCTIPDDGYDWLPTRQPIVLDAWYSVKGGGDAQMRTLMQWDSYRSLEYEGIYYGMKSDSFSDYTDLPMQVNVDLALVAFRLPSNTKEELEGYGWSLGDAKAASRDPWSYQEFIHQSKAEFTVAKQGYIITRCGWFSERTACFLASGRPAVVQDTGFTDWLKSEGGVLAFADPEEAIAGLEEVDKNYDKHCRLARLVAEEYFDSDRVLSDLLDWVLS